MSTIIHTMRGDFCTTCNETREWLAEHNGLMVDAIDATRFELGDIIQIGKGARRWMVTSIWADGRIALGKIAARGERGEVVGVYPGIYFEGLLLGNDHRYFDADDQGGLTRLGRAEPLPYDHEIPARNRAALAR